MRNITAQVSDNYTTGRHPTAGFTMVELIIVIIVIGIIASIATVGYSQWRPRVAQAQIKSDLNGVLSAMENARNFENVYPSSLPSSFTPTNGVIITGGSPNGYIFCFEATNYEFPNLRYYIESGSQEAQIGTCPLRVAQVSAYRQSTCSLTFSNKVYCWGSSYTGSTLQRSPVELNLGPNLTGKVVKTISSGLHHACLITTENKAYCWGNNSYGQLGDGTTDDRNVPVPVDTTGYLSGLSIKAIASGYYSTCAIASDDNAYCWGWANSGQLGDGRNASEVSGPVGVYKDGVLSGKSIKAITAALSATCVIASDNQAYCWGNTNYGQLGNNGVATQRYPSAVYRDGALNGKTIKSIGGNWGHVCVIASDNQAYCWGNGSSGQLGNGGIDNVNVPVAVDKNGALNGKTVKSIMQSSGTHTCAVASDNKTYCWGNNSYGQLGDGSTDNSLTPAEVYGSGALNAKTIKSISGGIFHTCSITSDYKVYCWGSNASGALGIGINDDSHTPVMAIFP